MNKDTFDRLYNENHRCVATYIDEDGIRCLRFISGTFTSTAGNLCIEFTSGFPVQLEHVEHVRDTGRDW